MRKLDVSLTNNRTNEVFWSSDLLGVFELGAGLVPGIMVVTLCRYQTLLSSTIMNPINLAILQIPIAFCFKEIYHVTSRLLFELDCDHSVNCRTEQMFLDRPGPIQRTSSNLGTLNLSAVFFGCFKTRQDLDLM